MTTSNFWDYEVWSFLLLISVILGSLLIANLLKRVIKPLNKTLIPTSVLAGVILLIITTIYKAITNNSFFDLEIFGGNGTSTLEILTYHCLGIGFIAMGFRRNNKKFDKQRTQEIFDTGVTTVSTYLLQGILGLIITIVFVILGSKLTFKAAGILLPFGYGQGTGQALNYGNIYEQTYGFTGGKSFGLMIAALGFLSASVGGVILLNILRTKGKVKTYEEIQAKSLDQSMIQDPDEVPTTESMDKLTIQVAIVLVTYVVSYGIMWGISKLVPAAQSIIYGFNFLLGTLLAVLIKGILGKLKTKKVLKREYLNTFYMNRIGGLSFDIMIVAGIGAIQLDLIKDYWIILVIMGLLGAIVTFFYLLFTSKYSCPAYQYQQFFAMYGMLTGTASTGIILLREIDPEFASPASDNLVYQNLPAIIFGFPMMLLATYAPKSSNATYITLGIMIVFFIVMNIILFRKKIFNKKKSTH